MRDGKGTIEIVTVVTMAPFTVTVSEHVEWDPDKAECAEAKQRAVVAAQTIADYIRLMPDAAAQTAWEPATEMWRRTKWTYFKRA